LVEATKVAEYKNTSIIDLNALLSLKGSLPLEFLTVELTPVSVKGLVPLEWGEKGVVTKAMPVSFSARMVSKSQLPISLRLTVVTDDTVLIEYGIRSDIIKLDVNVEILKSVIESLGLPVEFGGIAYDFIKALIVNIRLKNTYITNESLSRSDLEEI
jgi:hypothetical protein